MDKASAINPEIVVLFGGCLQNGRFRDKALRHMSGLQQLGDEMLLTPIDPRLIERPIPVEAVLFSAGHLHKGRFSGRRDMGNRWYRHDKGSWCLGPFRLSNMQWAHERKQICG
jgi:hypothetical protein